MKVEYGHLIPNDDNSLVRSSSCCHSFYRLIAISHSSMLVYFFHAVFKGGEVKVEYGKLISNDDNSLVRYSSCSHSF